MVGGPRPHLVCTPAGMPVLWALVNPKRDEREVLQTMQDVDTDLIKEWQSPGRPPRGRAAGNAREHQAVGGMMNASTSVP